MCIRDRGSGDADQTVDGGEFVFFGFERGKESERGLKIVQVVGMGAVSYTHLASS